LYLTREEERMIDGEYGEWVAKAIRLLVKLGELNNAERLVEIKRAHLSGVSYKTVGDAALDLLRDMVSDGVKLKIYTTINPAGMDLLNWDEMDIPPDFAEKQKELIRLYIKLGAKPALTCAPYIFENKPDFGERVAFAESSAVVYVNSLIGARTNRHGSLDALSSAIIGKVPLMGLLLKENRYGNVFVDVNNEKFSESDFGLLGILVGNELSPSDIPIFRFKRKPSNWRLRLLGAALAASGAIAMFHAVGITPEAKTLEVAQGDRELEDKFVIDISDLKTVADTYFSKIDSPDAVFIGCPHASLDEIREIGMLLRGKKIRDGVRFWIFTSRYILEQVKNEPIYNILENAGVKIFADTCMVVAPIEEIGIRKVWTNGSKAAWYIPKFAGRKIQVEVKPISEIISMIAE